MQSLAGGRRKKCTEPGHTIGSRPEAAGGQQESGRPTATSERQGCFERGPGRCCQSLPGQSPGWTVMGAVCFPNSFHPYLTSFSSLQESYLPPLILMFILHLPLALESSFQVTSDSPNGSGPSSGSGPLKVKDCSP